MSYILDTFCRLARIDCVSRQEAEVSLAVKEEFLSFGVTLEEDDTGSRIGGNAGNLYAYIPGTLEGSILFSAHLDRVPGGQGITTTQEGDKLVSNGKTILAADDLSGVAAILDGVRRIREKNLPHKGIEILLTVAEEPGLLGSGHFDYSRIRSTDGYLFDAAGRIGTIVTAAPSQASLEIEVRGKAAHAGVEPEKGLNAVKALAHLIHLLPDGRLDHESTANWPILQAGGSATNIVCDSAYAKGETRSHNHDKMVSYIQKFHQTAKAVSKETGADMITRDSILCHAFSISENESVIRRIQSVFSAMGIPSVLEQSGGCMDANVFNLHGMRTVGVGTGMFNVHTFNEYQYIDDLVRLSELVERLSLAE